MKSYPRDIVATGMRVVPTVVEQTHRGERGWDIYSRLRERDNFMSAEEATAYGLVDQVLSR